MSKYYKEYCREAVERDPKVYGISLNEDGSRKAPPRITNIFKKKAPKNIPYRELKNIKRDGWVPCEKKAKPELEVTGTEVKIKGRIQNLITKEIPANASKKEYNRIWMYNTRVRAKIKKLKEKYGDAIPL